MLLIPAIDLKEGKAVRLRQGRMDDATVFSDDPVAMARRWHEAGARRLHLVDLDGAFAGKPKNAELVRQIVAACPGLPVEIGGGIRNRDIAKAYLDAGVEFVIIGTAAVRDPEFVDALCAEFPGQVIVGLDAQDGMVATDGWAEVSTVSAADLGKRFADAGVSAILYTDIARDGMMAGCNVEATAALAEACGLPVIASGGVSSMDDIRALCAAEPRGVTAAILGRALYEGALELESAQQLADQLGQAA